MKDPKNVEKGRLNRVHGRDFELRVRNDLQKQGWIVCKWQNNVETHKDKELLVRDLWKLIPAKHTFNPFTKAMSAGNGFPDFIAFRKIGILEDYFYEVIGVESKSNGYLKKDETEKCKWLLEQKIFFKILIAEKTIEGRKIIIKYKEFNMKGGIK